MNASTSVPSTPPSRLTFETESGYSSRGGRVIPSCVMAKKTNKVAIPPVRRMKVAASKPPAHATSSTGPLNRSLHAAKATKQGEFFDKHCIKPGDTVAIGRVSSHRFRITLFDAKEARDCPTSFRFDAEPEGDGPRVIEPPNAARPADHPARPFLSRPRVLALAPGECP